MGSTAKSSLSLSLSDPPVKGSALDRLDFCMICNLIFLSDFTVVGIVLQGDTDMYP